MAQTVLNFKLEHGGHVEITPYAGLGLYAEMYKAIELNRLVEQRFSGPGSGAGFKANSYVEPIIMMFIGGGRYIEDIRKIQVDEGLKRISQMKQVPTADAVGDWIRRDSEVKMSCLHKINNELSQRLLKRAKEETFTLDVDATAIEANKFEAEYTYKGYKGYMPMLGFLAELDWCIGYEFREGNESPGSRNYEFIKTIIEQVEKAGKRVGQLRSDSAAYQAEVMNDANSRGVKYTITVDQDVAIKAAIGRIPETDWKPLKDKHGIGTDRQYAEFIHSMNKTDHAFRVVMQRWVNPQRDLFEQSAEYCYHGIAANYLEEEKDGETIIHWHNGRGNSENYNKEVKIGFNLEYLPCGDFGANGVWFGLGLLAYQLFTISKLYLFPSGWLKKTIRTVRWQFIEMAGKVIRHARRLVLKICGVGKEIFEVYETARQKCLELQALL